MSNAIQDEPSYATTLKVRDTCLCLHVQRAARALARRFDAALRPAGLTNGQFSLLMGLNRPQPPTIGSVAALLAMDRTTLTAMLKPLARRGLLEVREDPEDRRNRRLVLTEAGRTALRTALPFWTAEHATLDRLLGLEEMDRLRGALLTASSWPAHGSGLRPARGQAPAGHPRLAGEASEEEVGRRPAPANTP